MADKIGVLGGATGETVGTHTIYTCPANKAAKFRFFGKFQSGAVGSSLALVCNGVTAGVITAIPANNFTFTNGGAGVLRAAGAVGASGISAAETCQPAPPIYYLSAGQTAQYVIGTADFTNVNCQVVGIEIDLIA